MPKELLRGGVGVVVPRRRPLSAWRKRSTLTLLMPAWWRALLILDMTFRMFGVCVLSFIYKPLHAACRCLEATAAFSKFPYPVTDRNDRP